MNRYWISSPEPQETPFPKWMYHATEEAVLVNNAQQAAALGPEWSDTYIPKAYPKVMYKDDQSKLAADPEQEAALVADGWSDTPPVIPDVPPVTLDPESDACLAAGGGGTFTVTVDGPGHSGTWTVDKQSEATWLHVVSPLTPQSASGTVEWTADANANSARSGDMYINGKTFSVNQAGEIAAKKKKNG